MFFSSGRRSRIFASFSQPASSVMMAFASELDRRNSSASSPNSANSGNRDHAGAKRRQMRDRQFQRLRQEHRDAVAADEAIGLQHIGEPARHLRDLVERGPRRGAVLVDIDQREAARAVGIAVAARGRDVESRRDVPAEIAVELVVGGGFGEHGMRPSNFSSRRPGERRDPYSAAGVVGKGRQRPACKTITAGGYGSRPSPGRQP